MAASELGAFEAAKAGRIALLADDIAANGANGANAGEAAEAGAVGNARVTVTDGDDGGDDGGDAAALGPAASDAVTSGGAACTACSGVELWLGLDKGHSLKATPATASTAAATIQLSFVFLAKGGAAVACLGAGAAVSVANERAGLKSFELAASALADARLFGSSLWVTTVLSFASTFVMG